MTNTSSENAALIHNLEILQREIAIEGELQLASIARVFAHHIPLYIEKLRKLEELENGKSNTGASKEADRIPLHIRQSGHQAMLMRTIPD